MALAMSGSATAMSNKLNEVSEKLPDKKLGHRGRREINTEFKNKNEAPFPIQSARFSFLEISARRLGCATIPALYEADLSGV